MGRRPSSGATTNRPTRHGSGSGVLRGSMVPLYTAEKVTKSTLTFFSLALHPKALLFEYHVDRKLVEEGVVSRASVEHFRKARRNLVNAFTVHDPDAAKGGSLPLTARFWPVPKERLEVAEGQRSLFDDIEGWRARLDDPDQVLIHKSNWDHSVWDIDGEEILMPVELSVWGKQYDLKQVELHLTGHPAVVSFEIVPNDVWQNHEISGTHLGELVIDPRKFDRALLPKIVNRSWLQDHVVRGYSGKEHDLLGLASLRKPS